MAEFDLDESITTGPPLLAYVFSVANVLLFAVLNSAIIISQQ